MLEREREREGKGGRARERERERERCGPLLPVGEVMQTDLNIKAATQNQTKSKAEEKIKLSHCWPQLFIFWLFIIGLNEGQINR